MQTQTRHIAIPLVVTGVDLDDEAALDVIGANFDDLTWHAEAGKVIATLHAVSTDPVTEAVKVARAITAIRRHRIYLGWRGTKHIIANAVAKAT